MVDSFITVSIIFKLEKSINLFQSCVVFLSWAVYMLLNCFIFKNVWVLRKASLRTGTYSKLHSEANYPLGSACLQSVHNETVRTTVNIPCFIGLWPSQGCIKSWLILVPLICYSDISFSYQMPHVSLHSSLFIAHKLVKWVIWQLVRWGAAPLQTFVYNCCKVAFKDGVLVTV